MTNSDQSLSVVLPVYNAQNSLPYLINQMLDILPDIASEFEVLVIDDGSTDQTEEVARDLAIQYPQVRVTRHAERLGGEAVIRTGYERTRGKVVIVQQENTAFGQADLQRLWQMHAQQTEASQEASRDMHPTRLDSATEDYLAAWSSAFRNRMQPPSRHQLDTMAAELADNQDATELGPTELLRRDQGGGAQLSSTQCFGPSQPRVHSTHR
ncbi:MAG: glycosyltransferase family 2 protein [Pirellulaceae bacterium]|nr:glycosyltransferase family 2 protein [Pirellulaceae bacterium]